MLRDKREIEGEGKRRSKLLWFDWTRSDRNLREKALSGEAVFEGRLLAIDQMESLANQLEAPTAARKRPQADLLPHLSGCSAKRQRETTVKTRLIGAVRFRRSGEGSDD